MTVSSVIVCAAVTVGTWNGQWFPSGRAEHRAAPEIEAANVAAAGRILREGLAKADPSGTNDLILCFSEIRGPKAARELCEAVGRTNLTVAVVTGYRRRDRFDQQQDVIATTLPVASASWSRWRNAGDETPPRGYARAEVILSPAVTATVYAVHLKSNYGQTTEELTRRNRSKRARAVAQMIDMERSKKGASPRPVLVAGDFNADRWSEAFSGETLFDALESAGFCDVLEMLAPGARATYTGRGKWSECAFDYIFLRSLSAASPPVIVPTGGVSDHCPVFVTLRDCGTAADGDGESKGKENGR